MKESFLDNLRKKDRIRRQRIALGFSLFITLIALGSWFMLLDKNLDGQKQVLEKDKNKASPLASFKDGLDGITQSGVEQFGLFKKKFESQFGEEFLREVDDFEKELEKNNNASTSQKEEIKY